MCRKEVWRILLSNAVKELNVNFGLKIGTFLTCIIFSVYTGTGGVLTPRAVFSTIAHVTFIRYSTIHFVRGLLFCSDAYVGYTRIKVRKLSTNDVLYCVSVLCTFRFNKAWTNHTCMPFNNKYLQFIVFRHNDPCAFLHVWLFWLSHDLSVCHTHFFNKFTTCCTGRMHLITTTGGPAFFD